MEIAKHYKNDGRIISTLTDNGLPLPSHKSYKPLDRMFILRNVKIITDLNVSILGDHDIRTRRALLTRYYSVKARMDKTWKLAGHAPRLLIENVSYSVSENARRKIVARGSKEPHAFINGKLTGLVQPDEMGMHLMIMHRFIKNGAQYIHYCPYRTKEFVLSELDKLPTNQMDCDNLVTAPIGGEAYLFETGILYL